MKSCFTITLILLFSLTLFSQVIDPNVVEIINSTNIDSLTKTVSELSGMVPVVINDTLYTILSRYDTSLGNAKAALYINQKLRHYGLIPQYQYFIPRGTNVYALQQGIEHPGRMYIICAHYDDMPRGSVAPGADDNASGTAAVLEAARIFSKYQTSNSILYALWDREEQGLVGSSAYANLAASRGDSIMGVINLDMIAWDSNNDMSMDIHTKSIANSMKLSDTVRFVNSAYNIGLNPVVKNPGSTASDHASFWTKNYSALLLIESFEDFNTFYHTVNDRLSVFNNTFYHKMTKLAMGTLSVLVGAYKQTDVVSSDKVISTYTLKQNYPNPFNPTTTISYELPSAEFVTLEIFDMLGRRITTLVEEKQQAGQHAVLWNATGEASGTYLYRLKTGEFIQTKLMALIK